MFPIIPVAQCQSEKPIVGRLVKPFDFREHFDYLFDEQLGVGEQRSINRMSSELKATPPVGDYLDRRRTSPILASWSVP